MVNWIILCLLCVSVSGILMFFLMGMVKFKGMVLLMEICSGVRFLIGVVFVFLMCSVNVIGLLRMLKVGVLCIRMW